MHWLFTKPDVINPIFSTSRIWRYGNIRMCIKRYHLIGMYLILKTCLYERRNQKDIVSRNIQYFRF